YGVLKPLDIIEPYRLEMGTSLKVGKNKSLYEFWGEQISLELNEALKNHEEKVLINLASNEYFKAVDKKKLEAEVVSPQFKDAKNGKYKIIAFYAKKARGMMSRYIIENKISRLEDLQGFDYGGYRYNADLSSAKEAVFTREENQS
ncbi:MAG: peroxide stress protein YaaA, partial [Vicingaceae bacterium]